ncbi:MAG: SufD family Fe-S cluster assembly protein [Mycoplasmoidaceae bacterium]
MKIENKLISKKIIVPSNTIKRISIIDINLDDFDLNINVDVYENSKIIINLASLVYLTKKNFNIKINHLSNTSRSECNVFGVGKNQGYVKFTLTAKIAAESEGNTCEQSISGILLSNDSSIIGSPNLIIDTNKIQAKHALSIGKINEDKLFYLTSKNLSRQEAILKLIMSYFNLCLMNMNDEKILYIQNKIREKI